MLPEHTRSSEFELRHYLHVLRRRRVTVLAGVVVVVAVVLVVSFLQTPRYEATAQVVFQPNSAGQILNTQDTESIDPARDIQTQIDVLESSAVRTQVAKDLHLTTAPPIDAVADSTSNAIRIQATSTDPVKAAEIANSYAQEYTTFSRAQVLQYLTSVGNQLQTQIQQVQGEIDTLNQEIASAPKNSTTETQLSQQSEALLGEQTNLKQTLNQVQAQAAVPSGTGQLLTPATVPTSPSSPKTLRNGALAVVVGLLFGVALALLRDYFNDSITSKEELESSARGIPLVGMVPEISGWPSSGPPMIVSVTGPTSPAAEAYRTLRVSFQFLSAEGHRQVVQITSPGAGEGKTTTIANLGVALANAGQRVCLCCCDLRRPRLHEFFGLSTDIGLTSFLGGDVPLSLALHPVDGIEGLWILPSGPPLDNPSEALSSARTASLIKALRLQFDTILLDSPPVLPVADAVVLAELVDATILIATVGQTNRRGLGRAIELLRTVDAPILGTVLNRVSGQGSYGYGEGYHGYYETAPRRKPEVPTRPGPTARSGSGSAERRSNQ